MPIPTFTGMGPNPSFDDVTRKINTLVMELRNLMLSLDTLNIVELNAEVITAGTVTAEKMNVTELSAITANLGTITAGLLQAVTIISSTITGAFIQTKLAGNYPRVELSDTGYLRVQSSALSEVKTTPTFLSGGPSVAWNDPVGTAFISHEAFTNSFIIYSDSVGITIKSQSGDINLETPLGNVYVNGVPI